MKFIDVAQTSPLSSGRTAKVATEQGAAYAKEQPAETTETGVFGSLGINPTLFAFQLVNFAIVAAIIWFLILRPLTKKMSERQQVIDKSLENAKQIEKNLAHSEQKYQQRIDEAKVEANKIMERAQKEATEVAESMKAKAKAEIETLVEQARKNITTEREEAVKQVKQHAAELITMATEKMLGSELDKAKDQAVIEEALKSMK